MDSISIFHILAKEIVFNTPRKLYSSARDECSKNFLPSPRTGISSLLMIALRYLPDCISMHGSLMFVGMKASEVVDSSLIFDSRVVLFLVKYFTSSTSGNTIMSRNMLYIRRSFEILYVFINSGWLQDVFYSKYELNRYMSNLDNTSLRCFFY